MSENKTYTLSQYLSYNLTFVILVATAWILGRNDHNMIKYWFASAMTLLLLLRIPDFFARGYKHFLIEMCYYVNVLSIAGVLLGWDIRYIYPFLHGPLLLYCITSGDAVIPHNLTRTTSFAVHCFGTVVSRRLYWSGSSLMTLQFSNILETFPSYALTSLLLYLGWFVPYSVYVFWYRGTSLTMAQHSANIKTSPTTIQKIWYLAQHFVGTMLSLAFGIVLMHNEILNNVAVSIQLMSGLIQGGWYYYADGKKFSFKRLLKNDKKIE